METVTDDNYTMIIVFTIFYVLLYLSPVKKKQTKKKPHSPIPLHGKQSMNKSWHWVFGPIVKVG